MRRREAILAKKESRATQRLGEADYLLGVHDKNRMGALRFKVQGSEAYQCADTTIAAPPWCALCDLEYASFLMEHEEDDDEAGASYLEIVEFIMRSGSRPEGLTPRDNPPLRCYTQSETPGRKP